MSGDREKNRRGGASALIVAFLALTQLHCGDDGRANRELFVENPELAAAGRAAAATEVFGDAVDASTPVASVGDGSISAGDVAVYLRLYPTLSVEQAVEDLIDIRLAEAMGEEIRAFEERDAMVRGRVLAWMRRNLWQDPAVTTPDPERVHELLTEVRHTTAFGTPELVTVTHVLFGAEGEEEQTPEREAGAQELGARIRTALEGMDRPIYGFDLARAANETIPPDDPALGGVALYMDRELSFPREYSGAPVWNGLESVVPGFAEAAFAADIGVLVGPVQSDYGWHMIVV